LNEFHPNELDPFLLFDARDSMIGTLENPTLDLDPSKPDTLNVITATRAGTATYTDANGNIATASPDTVRVDHVDGVPMILVEPSATNLVTYSEDFTTGWTADDVSITGGQSSPDGGEVATLLKGNTNSSRHNIARFGTTNTVTGSFSLFAKAKELRYLQIASANTASQYANFDLLSGTIGTVASDFSNATIETYPDGWYRITVVSPNRYNAYYISLVSGLTAGWLESWAMPNDTDGLYIWGAQLEESSVATSYIPTASGNAAARTRASDELVISGSDFSDFFNGSAGTFFIQAQNRTPELNGAVLMGQNSNKLFFYKSNPNRLSTYDGGSFTHHDGLVANQLFNAAVTFNTSNRSSSLDGSALDTDTINTQWAGADILKIGFGYSNNFNGHYRRILFWPYHSDSL
jgi:hypothetical protein